ncbi:MAG: hypothetical protein IKC28_03285, partial [Clostridia bacterium]|nr:hypothetical protein [Clostridia bacterium]
TKRLVREARETEHSQGAPRTATVADDVKSPALLVGGVKGTRAAANKQRNSQQTAVGRGLCPPAGQKGNPRDLTKGSVSPFSAYSFSKE